MLMIDCVIKAPAYCPPMNAHITAEHSIVQSLPDAENLVEQGRKFYETEQFASSTTIWQRAVAAFKASGDELKLAMTLGNLALAYKARAKSS